MHTGVSREVTQWLASEFLPALTLVGIKQLAWVVSLALRMRNGILDALKLYPHLALDLFDELELAVAWLQQPAPFILPIGCCAAGRPHNNELKLRCSVERLARQLLTAQPVLG